MPDNPFCPMCEGLGAYLGALGRLLWFRCIQCGAEFNLDSHAHASEEDF